MGSSWVCIYGFFWHNLSEKDAWDNKWWFVSETLYWRANFIVLCKCWCNCLESELCNIYFICHLCVFLPQRFVQLDRSSIWHLLFSDSEEKIAKKLKSVNIYIITSPKITILYFVILALKWQSFYSTYVQKYMKNRRVKPLTICQEVVVSFGYLLRQFKLISLLPKNPKSRSLDKKC